MKLVIQLQLLATADQKADLLRTMERFNAAENISALGKSKLPIGLVDATSI
jgi:hypothetical protein